MGAVKKVFKGAAKIVSKGVGAITGSNAAKKAAEQQTKALNAQAAQEAKQAALSMADQSSQAAAQQSMQESAAVRDQAIREAEEKKKKAQEGSGEELDVSVGSNSSTGGSGDDTRRVTGRDSFFSRGGGQTGLRL
ncbi:hypothetical protein [Escherichia phage vB_EcoP_LHP]